MRLRQLFIDSKWFTWLTFLRRLRAPLIEVNPDVFDKGECYRQHGTSIAWGRKTCHFDCKSIVVNFWNIFLKLSAFPIKIENHRTPQPVQHLRLNSTCRVIWHFSWSWRQVWWCCAGTSGEPVRRLGGVPWILLLTSKLRPIFNKLLRKTRFR